MGHEIVLRREIISHESFPFAFISEILTSILTWLMMTFVSCIGALDGDSYSISIGSARGHMVGAVRALQWLGEIMRSS